MKTVIEFASDIFCAATRLEKTTSGHRTIVKDYPDAEDSLTALIESRDAEIHALYAPVVEALEKVAKSYLRYSKAPTNKNLYDMKLIESALLGVQSTLAAIKEVKG